MYIYIYSSALSHSVMSVTQSCLTLCNTMNCSPQAPLSMGFSRQESCSGLPCPPPGNLPNPGIEPGSPAMQADSLPYEPPRNIYVYIHTYIDNRILFIH